MARAPMHSGSSNRQYERMPCDLPGILADPGTSDLICRIRDICAGGMLIELTNSTALSDTNQPVVVSTTVRTHGHEQALRLEARVAHVQDTRVGVAFARPLDGETLQLLGFPATAAPGAAPFPGGTINQNPAAEPVLQILESGIQSALPPLLEAHGQFLHDEFAEQLITTYGSGERQALELALHGLGKDRPTVSRQVTNTLVAWLRLVAAGGRITMAPKQEGSQELSLVDDLSFDQWLTVSTVATRAEEAYADLLAPIATTLSHLFGQTITVHELPIGPAAICQAYYEHADAHMNNSEIARQVFSLFERNAVLQLGNYYAEILRTLESRGLVKAAREQRKSAAQPSLDVGSSSSRAPAEGFAAASPEGSLPQINPRSETTAQDEPPAFAGSGHGRGSAGTLPVESLLQSLSMIRRPDSPATEIPGISNDRLTSLLGSISTDQVSAAAYLGDLVQEQLQRQGEPGMNPSQFAHANLVGQIFTRISNDKRFPRQVSDTLKSLQIPYLKLVLREPGALADRKHPARIALEQISDLLIEQEHLSPGLQQSIELACERLVNQFPDQPGVFKDISEEFANIRKTDDQVKLRNLERVMATQDGQQKIIDTRLQVADQCRELCDEDGCLPRVLYDLLIQFGVTQLVNLYLQQGPDCEPARETLSSLRKLAAYFRERHLGQGTLDSTSAYQDILQGLQSELRSTFAYDAATTAILTRLNKLGSDENTGPHQDLEPVPVDQFFKNEAQARRAREVAGDLNNPWVRKIRSLQAGQEIVMGSAGESPRSVMLAWHARDWSRLVFVNRKGMHVCDTFISDMVDHLRDGSWHLDSRQSSNAVDSAILDVMQDVAGDLSIQAREDELTGLQNRRVLETRLEQILRDKRRTASPYHYLLINIDRFRLFNLDYGHEAGDRLLTALSMTLKQLAPPDAMHARMGSDEFCLVLQDQSTDEAVALARELVAAVSSLRDTENFEGATTVSIGIVVIDGKTESMDQIFRDSQAATGKCKAAGGNQALLFDHTTIDETASGQQTENWDQTVNRVLETRCLRLFHQPIRPTKPEDGHRHSEILLRIDAQNGADVSTFDFIVAAESSGRISEVDRWVLANTLSWMEECPDALEELGGVAINLSAESLGDERFMEFIIASVRLSRIKPEHICFELTETATVRSMDQLRNFIDTIKALGCKFALDDFGSGMASYSYLKNLPVDYLKIDGVFIRDLKNSPADAALVRSIADFARFMGIHTIAEFVEDAETMSMLGDIGVDYVQGYHLGKPSALPMH